MLRLVLGQSVEQLVDLRPDDDEGGAVTEGTSSVDLTTMVIDHASVPVLEFAGDLDLDSTDQLIQAAVQIMHIVPNEGLVIDLSRTTFLDSRGIGGLLAIRRLLAGRPIYLRGASPIVRETLRMMSLETHLTILDGTRSC